MGIWQHIHTVATTEVSPDNNNDDGNDNMMTTTTTTIKTTIKIMMSFGKRRSTTKTTETSRDDEHKESQHTWLSDRSRYLAKVKSLVRFPHTEKGSNPGLYTDTNPRPRYR